jgi:hypothetical protein
MRLSFIILILVFVCSSVSWAHKIYFTAYQSDPTVIYVIENSYCEISDSILIPGDIIDFAIDGDTELLYVLVKTIHEPNDPDTYELRAYNEQGIVIKHVSTVLSGPVIPGLGFINGKVIISNFLGFFEIDPLTGEKNYVEVPSGNVIQPTECHGEFINGGWLAGITILDRITLSEDYLEYSPSDPLTKWQINDMACLSDCRGDYFSLVLRGSYSDTFHFFYTDPFGGDIEQSCFYPNLPLQDHAGSRSFEVILYPLTLDLNTSVPYCEDNDTNLRFEPCAASRLRLSALSPELVEHQNHIDSLVVTLTSGLSDLGLSLDVSFSPRLDVTQLTQNRLVIHNTGGATPTEFVRAIRETELISLGGMFMAGSAEVTYVAHSYVRKSLPATAHLEIDAGVPDAGSDVEVLLCMEDGPVDLTLYLSPGVSGGSWSEGPIFDPGSSVPGVYDYVVSKAGCPSDTAFVEVQVQAAAQSRVDNFWLCAGDSVQINGVWIDSSTELRDTLLSATGNCDSLYRLTRVTRGAEARLESESRTLCGGDSIFFGGVYQKVSGLYEDASLDIRGCDSLIRALDLAVLAPASASSSDTIICSGERIDFFGQVLTASGDYSHRESYLAQSCDSLVVELELTVLPLPVIMAENVRICEGDSVLIGSLFQSEAGIYRDTLRYAQGCDSLHREVQVILLADAEEALIDTTLCHGDSLLLSGIWYTEAIQFRDTLMVSGLAGCDSLYREVRLDFYAPPVSESVVVDLCAGDSLLIAHDYETVAGDYGEVIFSRQTGCDSIHREITLRFTADINQEEEMISFCAGDSTLVNGIWYKESGVVVDTLRTIDMSCDSLYRRYVLEEGSAAIRIEDERRLCFGDSLIIDGITYMEDAQLMQVVINNVTGCDSLIEILTIDFSEPMREEQTALILCAGDTLEIAGQMITSPGNYSEELQTIEGCDSLRIEIEVEGARPVEIVSVDTTLCMGDILELGGLSVGSSGSFMETIQSREQGCDSIIYRGVLTYYAPSQEESIDTLLCAGQSVTIGGETYDLSGDYAPRVLNEAGCDSIVYVVTVEVGEALNLTGERYYEVLRDSQIVLQVESGIDADAVVWSWSPAEDLSCIDCPSPILTATSSQIYEVVAEDAMGCQERLEIEVVVMDLQAEPRVYISEVMDRRSVIEENRYFYIQSGQAGSYDIQVYDRWGGLMFAGRDLEYNVALSGWDGTRAGRAANQGVYVYKYQLDDGRSGVGTITLF